MLLGEQVQVLSTHAFFACIQRNGVEGALGIGEPAAQRFSINAQTKRGLGQRHKSHGTTPFKGKWKTDERQPGMFPGVFPGRCETNRKDYSQEHSRETALAEGGLARFLPTTTMVVASPILMRASEERPLQDQRDGGGSREDEMGEQMLD